MIKNPNLIKLIQYLSTKITEKINAAPIIYETDPIMGYSEYLEFASELLTSLEDPDSIFQLIPATRSITIITADLLQYAPFIKNYSATQLSMFRNTLTSSLQTYFESIVVPTTPVKPDPEPETPPTDEPGTKDPAPEEPNPGDPKDDTSTEDNTDSKEEQTSSDNTPEAENPSTGDMGSEGTDNPDDITDVSDTTEPSTDETV